MCASRNMCWRTVTENPFAGDDEFRVPGVWTPEEGAAGPQYVTRKEFAQYVAAMNQHGVMAVNSTEDSPHPEMKVQRLGFAQGYGVLTEEGMVFYRAEAGPYIIGLDARAANKNESYPRTIIDYVASVGNVWSVAAQGSVSDDGVLFQIYSATALGRRGWQLTDSSTGASLSFHVGDLIVNHDRFMFDGAAYRWPTFSGNPATIDSAEAWYDTATGKFMGAVSTTAYAFAREGGPQILGDFSELTIASGVITVTTSAHTVDTEADAASDDLDSISGGTTGQILVLRAANGGRTVNLIDGLPLRLSGDCALDNAEDTITLICQGSTWYEIARSNNGA